MGTIHSEVMAQPRAKSAPSPLCDECGIAFVEFAIALPFIAMMMVAVVDVGYALNQYMLLSEVVHQGVRVAAGEGDLSNGPAYCQGATGTPQNEVDLRVIELVERQELKFHANSLCVTSGVSPSGSEVFVAASAKYRGIFPAFDSLQLNVRATAPKL